MHTQQVKFSAYVGGGVEDVVVDAIADSLPSSSSFSFGGTGGELVSAMKVVVVVVVVVAVAVVAVVSVVVVVMLMAVVVVVVVISFASFAPSLSPPDSGLFASSSCFFLSNDAFFSASALADAFNRLHSLLCPPSFQCVIWQSRLQ